MPTPSKAQIKVSALSRLLVEYKEYVEEENQYQTQVKALEDATPRDEYEIKRSKLILEETKRVRARVLQLIKEHAAEVKKIGGPETKSPKAVEALEAAAKLK